MGINTYSQVDTFVGKDTISKHGRFNADFGCGYGLNYAGFLGAKLQYAPISRFAIFGSGGFSVYSLGWQLGITGYIIPKTPDNPVRVYCSVMYGTIAVYEVQKKDANNKSYYGITPVVGLEVRLGKKRKHGFNVDVMFPFPTGSFQYDYDNVGGNWYTYSLIGGVYGKGTSPITLSIGYHFEMR